MGSILRISPEASCPTFWDIYVQKYLGTLYVTHESYAISPEA